MSNKTQQMFLAVENKVRRRSPWGFALLSHPTGSKQCTPTEATGESKLQT